MFLDAHFARTSGREELDGAIPSAYPPSVAYAQSAPVITPFKAGGRNFLRLTFTETEAGPATQWQVGGVFMLCTIVSMRVATSAYAGGGTTVAPLIGNALAFVANSVNHIGSLVAAAFQNDQSRVVCDLPIGRLVGRTNVDVGTCSTSYVIILAEGLG